MLRKTIVTAAVALGFALAAAPVAEAGGQHHNTVTFGYIQSFGYGYHANGFGYGYPCYKGFGYERGRTYSCPGVKNQGLTITPTQTYAWSNFYPRGYYSNGYWPTRFRGPIYYGNRHCKKPFPYPVSYHSRSDF